jgi:predicted acetyltransferase
MTDSPAGIEFRPVSAGEMPALFDAVERAFGSDVSPEVAPYEIAALQPARSLAGFDGDRIIATAGIFTFEMTVPGGPVPVAGVTWVGVLPTHRRRGILTAIMRRQLNDLHDSGEPVAALWASEPVIYRRFGYGSAAVRLGVKAESRAPFGPGAPALAGTLRMVDPKECRQVAEELYDRIRADRPGLISRDAARWDLTFLDVEKVREGASSLTCVVVDTPDGPAGYVLYRTKPEWGPTGPNGTVQVRDLFATTPAAYAALWRYVLDIDLMRTVQAWNRPTDDPLLYLLGDIRRAQPSLGDALWVRLVDVARALETRTYPTAGSVVLEVVDDVCPWNAGRVRLDGGPDGATCTPTDESADLTLSATELGSAYLGGTRLGHMAAAGYVDEHTPGALDLADGMFAGRVAPWGAEVF